MNWNRLLNPIRDCVSRSLMVLMVLMVFFALILPACTPLLLGGVVGGAVLSGTDRRTTGAQLDDQRIESKANELLGKRFPKGARFEVVSYNRQVLILGEVPQARDVQEAEAVVAKIENVRSTWNELQATGTALPTTSQILADTTLTAKVKTAWGTTKDISTHAGKVVTHQGRVYVLGRVTTREAERMASVASGVPGVKQVIRLFEIISEEELASLQNTPPPSTPAGDRKP